MQCNPQLHMSCAYRPAKPSSYIQLEEIPPGGPPIQTVDQSDPNNLFDGLCLGSICNLSGLLMLLLST